MGASVCKKCGGAMNEDPSDPRLSKCAGCGAELMSLFLEDRVELSEGLGVEGQSEGSVGGLPEREFSRYSDSRGHTSAQDVDRAQSPGGVDRQVRHDAPYRRDSRGTMKRAEECDAVRRLLSSFNELHGTAHAEVKPDQDDADADVLVDDLKFQVTHADPKPWSALASPAAAHSETLDELHLVERFFRAAEAKKTRAARDLILVLDGAGVSTTAGTIKLLISSKQRELAAIGFAEIWWSDQHRVIRLFPPDPRGT